MKPDELEAQMRRLECYHSIRCPPGAWVILRLDGRGFSRFTEGRCEKPFDTAFHGWMVATARAVLEDFGGLYGYTESDEISLLLPRSWELFDREVEKAVSVSAGLASATFTLACGSAAHFDGRVCLAATDEQVVDYFRWRQADAARCALNGWCYWTLRKAGHTSAEAERKLAGLSVADKNELLFGLGVHFNDVPAWQRRGTGLYWEEYDHVGRNPVLDQEVVVTRRRVKEDRELPMGETYSTFLAGLMADRQTAQTTADRRSC